MTPVLFPRPHGAKRPDRRAEWPEFWGLNFSLIPPRRSDRKTPTPAPRPIVVEPTIALSLEPQVVSRQTEREVVARSIQVLGRSLVSGVFLHHLPWDQPFRAYAARLRSTWCALSKDALRLGERVVHPQVSRHRREPRVRPGNDRRPSVPSNGIAEISSCRLSRFSHQSRTS